MTKAKKIVSITQFSNVWTIFEPFRKCSNNQFIDIRKYRYPWCRKLYNFSTLFSLLSSSSDINATFTKATQQYNDGNSSIAFDDDDNNNNSQPILVPIKEVVGDPHMTSGRREWHWYRWTRTKYHFHKHHRINRKPINETTTIIEVPNKKCINTDNDDNDESSLDDFPDDLFTRKNLEFIHLFVCHVFFFSICSLSFWNFSFRLFVRFYYLLWS